MAEWLRPSLGRADRWTTRRLGPRVTPGGRVWVGTRPGPRPLGESPASLVAPACVASSALSCASGGACARRQGCHGFRGHVGARRSPLPPAAVGRGGAARAGERSVAAAGAESRRCCQPSPGRAVQPPPPHGTAARREPRPGQPGCRGPVRRARSR